MSSTSITCLPDEVLVAGARASDPILIYPYTASKGSFREKAILTKNAISLVLAGEKTMHFASRTVVATDNEFHFLSAGNCMASVDLSKQDVFKSILIFFDNKVLAD